MWKVRYRDRESGMVLHRSYKGKEEPQVRRISENYARQNNLDILAREKEY